MVKIHKTLTTARLFDIIINRKLRPNGQMFVLFAKNGVKKHIVIVAFDQSATRLIIVFVKKAKCAKCTNEKHL